MARSKEYVEIKDGVFYVHADLAAQIFGITVQTLYQWKSQPEPPPFNEELNKYPLTEIGDWIRNKQIHRTGKGGSKPWKSLDAVERRLPGMTVEDQKVRLERLRADKLQIEIDTITGKLVEVDEVTIAMTSMVSRVKTRLLSIPTSIAPVITGVEDMYEVQEEIEKSILVALEELSSDWRNSEETDS
jgi:phage terminase Nu1 subunit (DNA packaging protein)